MIDLEDRMAHFLADLGPHPELESIDDVYAEQTAQLFQKATPAPSAFALNEIFDDARVLRASRFRCEAKNSGPEPC